MKTYNSVTAFQRACLQSSNAQNNFVAICEMYKKILDSNFSKRFCVGDHCKTIFMVEIRFEGFSWGGTPKVFNSREEAENEAKYLRGKYTFLAECRVITRKVEEKEGKEGRKEGLTH